MSRINIILKPTAECNLRCKYCYHAATNYVTGKMDMSMARRIMELASDEFNEVKITWHGGEPMLMGRKFYREIFKYQRELSRKKHVTFYNTMQTNGTLISSLWAIFFKTQGIVPGISFDGPCTNDKMRGGTKEVLKGLKRLKRYRVRSGCLAVINRHNIDVVSLYEEMKPLCYSLKFNPVFSTDGDPEYQIDVNEYIENMKRLFDRWLYDKKGIPLEPMRIYMYKALGIPYNSCVNSSCLGKWMDIDAGGIIRVCGQSSDDAFIIGNIDEVERLSDVFRGERFNNIVRAAISRRKKCAEACGLFKECQGNCIFKDSIEGGIEKLGGFSCRAFREIYGYIKEKTTAIIKENTPLDILNPTAKKIITDAMSSNTDYILSINDD